MSLTLYLKASSRLLNPLLDAELEAEDYASDPEKARSNWGGEFRAELSQYVPEEYLSRSIQRECHSNPYESRYAYAGFIDVSGGAHDRMVLAISHRDEQSRVVLDKLVTVQPPFDFFATVESFSGTLNSYGLRIVTGDRYLAEISPQAFHRHGIIYQPSELSKSEIFAQLLPLFSADMIQLLDIKSLHTEFRSLERRARSGRAGDMIEVPRHGFDDQCNAAAGSLLLCANSFNARNADDGQNNITAAIREYDVLAAADPIVSRATPRHLPAGFGGYEEDYSRSLRSYDPPTETTRRKLSMAFKSKVAHNSPVAKARVSNAKGFNRTTAKLGPDTQPGPGPGAPLMNHARVDDAKPKKTVYFGGRTPGNLNEPMQVGIVATPPGAQSRPHSSSVPINAPHPDLAKSKAEEVAQADSAMGLGTFPAGGVLGRG